MTFKTLGATALALLSAVGFANPVFAGACPAGQAAPNALAGAPTMPKAVTDTVIGSVDLGAEILALE